MEPATFKASEDKEEIQDKTQNRRNQTYADTHKKADQTGIHYGF